MPAAPTPDPAPPPTTRSWTLVGPDLPVDVEVTAREDDSLGAVLPEIERVLGHPVPGLWAGSARLPDHLLLSAPVLQHGSVLGVGRPVPGADRGQRSSALELRIVGGPDAGRAVPLGQGLHVLGRGSEASVRLDDPDVSRRHVAVQVGGGTITVADLASTNGSRLDEEQLDQEPRAWAAGATLRLGASAVSVAGPEGASAAVEPGPGGRLRLRASPRLRVPAPEVEVTFPQPPAPPPHRRLAWVAVALPAVGGVLMAWLLHTPTFLFFALLSPVVALGTWLSERWSGRRTGRRDAADHAVAQVAAHTRLAEAVGTDVRASETAHPDLAAVTAAARRRTSLLWHRARDDADALVVRVGSGPGPTRVIRVEGNGSRIRETAPHLPVALDLRAGGGLAVVGPRERAAGVLAGVIAQLTALHGPDEVQLMLLTRASRVPVWRWCRWLPHLRPGAVHVTAAHAAAPADDTDDPDDDLVAWLAAITARRRAAAPAGSAETAPPPSWLVVVVDRPLGPRAGAALRSARDVGIVVLTAAESPEDVPLPVDAVLRLTGETGDTAVLGRQGSLDRTDVVVDRLPSAAAATFARDLAALAPADSERTLPDQVRLLDLPNDGLRIDGDGAASGTWSPARDRLVAWLGRTAQGPVGIDLCRQGPHALVAGTTGSGKSELLQTLIAGLALNHPPERCSFLLVDYKGGAAFAEAAALPHTVGLVTDLDGQSTARALRSLGAELTRREEILAASQVSDIARLPDHVELARLVIVVDEFATLAEELPGFVPGLVAIAQRGRSLGVHLVLATQRPGGVVSPEIRANCTLRICLRTTDEADSRDVLGTTQAAHLPVDMPGRAYVRAGSGSPTALQVARVAAPAPAAGCTTPSVRAWRWPSSTAHPGSASGSGEEPALRESDLARIRSAVSAHARAVGTPPPHRPWQPPLPGALPVSRLDELLPGGGPGEATRLPVGLVDRPDRQARERLDLDLADGGTWLAVGGPRSGRTTLLQTVFREAVHRLAPGELHVHVVESGGGALAAEASAQPHTGTTVSGEDALRTVRLVERLGREVTARRAAPAPAGESRPFLLLLVDGVESVMNVLDDADPGRGSSALLRLVRDGAAVGLTCVLTADRAVPGGRLAAVARQRLILPLPDAADYAVAGVPARVVPAFRPPGRTLLGDDPLECQLALPRRPPPASTVAPGTRPPLRIVELPPDPVPTELHDGQAGNTPLRLPVGPGGDEGAPLLVDLLRSGGLLVSGPSGSGRTTALDTFAAHLGTAGAAVLRIGRPSPRRADEPEATEVRRLEPGDALGVSEWLQALAGRPGVVLADDVGTPSEWAALTALPAPGAGLALVAASSAGQLSGHYQGPVAALRRNRSGLLLCPGPGDADLLGVRLPRTPLPVRPGSGWLVTGGAMERVQVARHRASAPQSRSSAGPIS